MSPEIIFWLAAFLVLYTYLGYPVLLVALRTVVRQPAPTEATDYFPSVTMIVPVHNEERVIDGKLKNLDDLHYPRGQLLVLIVSDGSTDQTQQRVRAYQGDLQIQFLELRQRQGKAAALNLGLQHTTSEIVVFSDASILLDADAMRHIVRRFQESTIGCVSGEDLIPGGGGEGIYGRYELFLRNLESQISSIAGASGSFYAMRTQLCTPFLPGMAPDFLSVLGTVEHGYRAVTEPRAFGTMSSVKSAGSEFRRKVRTLIRGMTALWYARALLNPFRSGWFALVLWSHKLARWLVPFFLLAMLLANGWLISEPFYLLIGVAQMAFYVAALLALLGVRLLRASLPVKIAMYFTVVNAAIFVAWLQFICGKRLEIWEPTKR
jgi:cellulose synthase/poly-beta-1,6-N-acetylglucosamine synthase-like glycosyltransferase